MLKYTQVITSPAVFFVANVDSDNNARVLYLWYGIFIIPARGIQKSEYEKKAYVCSGLDYTFPALLLAN
jgi:hypothetical protein